jgi:chemotaxis protein CheD
MLPYWNGEGLPSPKYGNIAIKKLVEAMLNNGSKNSDLIAKVFGGANISQFHQNIYLVDKRNISVATSILNEYNIPVISSSIGGNIGRRIRFYTDTGKVIHNFIRQTGFTV